MFMSSLQDLIVEIFSSKRHYFLRSDGRSVLHMWVFGLQALCGLPTTVEWPSQFGIQPQTPEYMWRLRNTSNEDSVHLSPSSTPASTQQHSELSQPDQQHTDEANDVSRTYSNSTPSHRAEQRNEDPDHSQSLTTADRRPALESGQAEQVQTIELVEQVENGIEAVQNARHQDATSRNMVTSQSKHASDPRKTQAYPTQKKKSHVTATGELEFSSDDDDDDAFLEELRNQNARPNRDNTPNSANDVVHVVSFQHSSAAPENNSSGRRAEEPQTMSKHRVS